MTIVKLRIKEGVKGKAVHIVPLSEHGPVDRIVFNAFVDVFYGRELESAEEIEHVVDVLQEKHTKTLYDGLDEAGSGYWNKKEDQDRLYKILVEKLKSVKDSN